MKKLTRRTIGVTTLALLLIGLIGISIPLGSQPVQAAAQSTNVAVIDSLASINGGSLSTLSGLGFTFFTLTTPNVNAANLGPGGICGISGCDTVLLNVASSGMACDVNHLSASQKTDLVNFVGSGKKLIIYDSECSPQNYSWLPFPFTTSNPGAQGAHGTLTIVENNTLSSNDPSDPHYIDASLLSTNTDAVGDMNVMTTFDPNWCLGMSGTNVLGVTGPVHTYARFGTVGSVGLIIYNGTDVDFDGSSAVPDSHTGPGNLAKIWLQELQQSFNPDNLPCKAPVVGITLTPTSATHPVGQSHTVTAALTDLLGQPVANTLVTFTILSGPNVGATGTCNPASCMTDATGQVSFTYTGSGGIGTDQINACFTNQAGHPVCSKQVSVTWTNSPPTASVGGPYSGSEGSAIALSGATASDPENDPLTYAWTVTSVPEPGAACTFSSATALNPTITCSEEGAYTVQLSVDDGHNPAVTSSATVNVSDAALSAQPACPATSSQSFNGRTATFADAASPYGTLSDFSATIDWGDGSSSAGTVSDPDGGPYTVSGSHTYLSTGNFTISTTITDVGGSTTSTSCTTLVYAFAPGGGSFVIGDRNAAVGTSVTFWGAQWWKVNALSGGAAPASFKGFAASPTTPACGTSWNTDPGNSPPPPAGPLPAYMGVIATSSATKSGSTISGNTVHIVIVKTDSGYESNPGHAGTGSVVKRRC